MACIDDDHSPRVVKDVKIGVGIGLRSWMQLGDRAGHGDEVGLRALGVAPQAFLALKHAKRPWLLVHGAWGLDGEVKKLAYGWGIDRPARVITHRTPVIDRLVEFHDSSLI